MAALDIGVLVFRRGLECILVLAAITASMMGAARVYRRPVATGAAIAFLATLVTWGLAVRVIDDLTESFSAPQVQVVTGLLAIGVLLVVMNWFFHKVYWTGWIALHTTKKHALLENAARRKLSKRRLVLGVGALGFTSLYREGVEVVLFLQSYRLKLGTTPVALGVCVGLALTTVVAVLTFWLRRRLPYPEDARGHGRVARCRVARNGRRAGRKKCEWRAGCPRPRSTGSIGWCRRGWAYGSQSFRPSRRSVLS